MTRGAGCFVNVRYADRRRLAVLVRERDESMGELIREAVRFWLDAGAPEADDRGDREREARR